MLKFINQKISYSPDHCVQQADNLNELRINYANNNYKPMQDLGVMSEDGQTEVIFRNLPFCLCELIEDSYAVAGMAAWLTEENVLASLAKVHSLIVVGKEDWLRPDADWSKQKIRELYAKLKFDVEGWGRLPSLGNLDVCGSIPCQEGEAIRCIGNFNASKNPVFPRLHHKVFIFYRKEEPRDLIKRFPDWTLEQAQQNSYNPNKVPLLPIPYAVWTGSYNPTKNAGQSLENAVILRDRKIVNAYIEEFSQIYALSEPLAWESEWVAPSMRIGS